jgi:hypothetical protein
MLYIYFVLGLKIYKTFKLNYKSIHSSYEGKNWICNRWLKKIVFYFFYVDISCF